MPKQAVSAETMQVGKQGGGKHWTKEQKEARERAAAGLKRAAGVELIAPAWLSSGALFIWDQVITDAAELELLDNLDANSLAVFCDAMDRYQTLTERIRLAEIPKEPKKVEVPNEGGESFEPTADDPMALTKQMQAWARIIAQFADKLGLTPQARARLAKKRAEKDLTGNSKNSFAGKFD